MKPLPLVAAAVVLMTACAGSPSAPAKTTGPSAANDSARVTVILTSAVNWEQLNPARGDKSPRAATLWGDRNGTAPTGFLFNSIDGFKSPPHIHNVSYRGVVIGGLIHNDDPTAEPMWMPPGSFWTQPKGAVHITAAKGNDVLAYIEIEQGPYLVRPVDKAFETKERPINVDPSNIVWLAQPGSQPSANGPKVAYVWGDPQSQKPHGRLIKLPAGFAGIIRSRGEGRAVMIQGRLDHRSSGTSLQTLEPGSYVHAKGNANHQVMCKPPGPCVLYVRMQGSLDVVMPQR